jgi:hypothetical protein
VLFSGIAITAYAHVVRLQAPIDAHAVTRWWLQFKDKGQVSLLVGLVYRVTDKQQFGPSFTQFSCFDARLRIHIMTCTCNIIALSVDNFDAIDHLYTESLSRNQHGFTTLARISLLLVIYVLFNSGDKVGKRSVIPGRSKTHCIFNLTIC